MRHLLTPVVLTVAAIPVPTQEVPALPAPADIVAVTMRVDTPVAAHSAIGPRSAGEVLALLNSYAVLDPAEWSGRFSHVAGMDRVGRLVLRDGTEVGWMMRPGGLGVLTFPGGRMLHLAFASRSVRESGHVPPHDGAALPDLTIDYDGLDAVIRDAASEVDAVRFTAVRSLTLLEDNAAGRAALLRAVLDRNVPATTREYAAMGLGNYRTTMPDADAARVRDALRTALATERGDAPAGVVRAALRFDDAAAVGETLGEALLGHPAEVEVLAAIADTASRRRLWELREGIGDPRDPTRFTATDRVARALIQAGDVRGVEVEIGLLRVRDALPDVYGANVFLYLTTVLGEFSRWRGSPASAIPAETIGQMIEWWGEHGDSFELPRKNRRP